MVTASELQSQIDALLEQLAVLQAQLTAPQQLSQEGGQDQKGDKIRLFTQQRITTLFNELQQNIGKNVFNFLDPGLRNLLITSTLLDRVFEKYFKNVNEKDLEPIDMILMTDDYSFIVFPAAKVLEGYLKKLFIKLKLLKKSELSKDPFLSIGRILNDKEKDLRGKVKDRRFRHVPKEIQVEWDKSRNYILHYDLYKPQRITREEARKRIDKIHSVIKESYEAFYGK